MRNCIFLICLLFLTYKNTLNAQTTIKVQTGISYLEHFTTGFVVSLNNKHYLSISYGSNFFSKPREFSSYMTQYEVFVKKFSLADCTPKIGIKGGYSIFTNDYYQWELLALVPYIGANRPMSKRIELAVDLGTAFSQELSLRRISYGEIGSYKKWLPEIKFAILYAL